MPTRVDVARLSGAVRLCARARGRARAAAPLPRPRGRRARIAAERVRPRGRAWHDEARTRLDLHRCSREQRSAHATLQGE